MHNGFPLFAVTDARSGRFGQPSPATGPRIPALASGDTAVRVVLLPPAPEDTRGDLCAVVGRELQLAWLECLLNE